jgi:hypothetical protein
MRSAWVLPDKYDAYFELITERPDIFPGFFLFDVKNNILPKFDILRQFGFYLSLKNVRKSSMRKVAERIPLELPRRRLIAR